MEQRGDFNQVFWSLNSTPSPMDITGIQHIQTYWIKPDEARSGFETIHFEPSESPDKKGVSIMAVRQVVEHIALRF